MSEPSLLRLHAHVSGSVQGVGFRYFVMQAAMERHLTGWVRNRHDGRVEVMAEGEHDALNGFLIQLRRGPVSAFVEDVQYDFSEGEGKHTRFSVLPTG
ncbi:MAG: acylphosphatase [Anaerolineaceae bacterium]|nr:acylphosphatase [Anaerolineaceae bacterium]